MNRRHALGLGLCSLLGTAASGLLADITLLPQSKTVVGIKKFTALCALAQKENWGKLPMGARVARIAQEFRGTPYKSWTLEIDDRVECASANLDGLDCWTFFEISLGFARMLESRAQNYRPVDLLVQLEWTRYRAGTCTGSYLERIHYLTEWYFDNDARGNVVDITRTLPGAVKLQGRRNDEMTSQWKSYRYLKADSKLVMPLVKLEKLVDALPTFYIPNAGVARIHGKLQDGDIIGIVTNRQGTVCSHVGLIVHASDGLPHFMHASSNFKKVVLDAPLADYLAAYPTHQGIIVARPLPASKAVRDGAKYRANLKKLRGW